jgi:hypothetical protein
MDARQNKRFIVSLEAELILKDVHIASSIENLSERGVYVVAAPSKFFSEFAPDTCLELKFQLPSGEKQCLNCRVKWSYKTPPHGLTNSIGMEIIDPPSSFKESLRALI